MSRKAELRPWKKAFRDDFSSKAGEDSEGFFFANQANERLGQYKARAKAAKQKKVSGFLGSMGSIFSGGFCTIIPRIFGFVEKAIAWIFSKVAYLEKYMLKFCQALYIPKTILFLTILIIALLEFLTRYFNGLEFLSSEHVLQGVYSVAKLINVILIFVAVLMGMAKVIQKTNNNSDNMPFPLLLVGTLVGSMPLLYELLSLVALSSITLAYYSQKCNGKITNTWTIVDNIGGTLLAFGVIGIIISFLQFRFRKACAKDGIQTLQAPNVLMLTSLGYFVVLMLASGFEQTVSQNVAYWMGLMGNKENPFEDCVKDNELNPTDDGMKKVLNLMLSIVITILMTIIIVIGVIPPIWIFASLGTLNMNIRARIGETINKIFSLIITPPKKQGSNNFGS